MTIPPPIIWDVENDVDDEDGGFVGLDLTFLLDWEDGVETDRDDVDRTNPICFKLKTMSLSARREK